MGLEKQAEVGCREGFLIPAITLQDLFHRQEAQMRKFFFRLGMSLLAVAAVVISGCATTTIGSIRPNADVTRQFQEIEINPNFRYWYLNQENNPFGVLGIDREYRFEGGPMWTPVDPDAAAFNKVVGLVQRFPVKGSYSSGYEIVDSQGRQIGTWYSSLNAGVTVDSAGKVVVVTTQTPWTRPFSFFRPEKGGDRKIAVWALSALGPRI